MCFVSIAHQQKLADAVKYLGVNWVLHPMYSRKKNPHHDLTHRKSATLEQFSSAMADARAQNRPLGLFFLRT